MPGVVLHEIRQLRQEEAKPSWTALHKAKRRLTCYSLHLTLKKVLSFCGALYVLCQQNTSVSLQLLVQNQRRKWHFPLNFQNGINWTSPFLLNICNAINWAGAFSKAFSSSEALISVLSKNACLYDNISNSFQSKTLYIVLIFKWSCLDTNLWICNLCICH